MPWFNTGNRTAVFASGTDEIPYTISGIPGYSTEAQAESHPLSILQQSRLSVATLGTGNQAGVISEIDPFALGAAGVADPASAENSIPGKAVIGTVNAAKAAVMSVPEFLSRLSERATWIRVAEAVIGLGLVLVAVDHLTDGGVTKAVKTGAKVAGTAALL